MQMIFNIVTMSSCELRKAMRTSQICLECQEIGVGRVLNRLFPLFHFPFVDCFLLKFIFVIIYSYIQKNHVLRVYVCGVRMCVWGIKQMPNSLPSAWKKRILPKPLSPLLCSTPVISLSLPEKWVSNDCELLIFSLPLVALYMCICLNNILYWVNFFLISFSLLTQISQAMWYLPVPLYYPLYSLSLSPVPQPNKTYYFCPSTDLVRRDFRKEPGFRFTWPRSGCHWLAGAGTSTAKANERIQEWKGSHVRIATLRSIRCPRWSLDLLS